jgi:hypothetical protein
MTRAREASKSATDSAQVTEVQEETISPFWLKSAFPDAQGIFDARHQSLDSIKDDCFVALDTNVLLLPYKLEEVSLSDIIDAYRPLAVEKRLVVPAQAAREFAKHRSSKVGELVKYLREQASLSGPMLTKKIGALVGHAGFEAAKAKVADVKSQIKELQAAIMTVAEEIASDVGEDPVSIAYRDLFEGAVRDDPPSCADAKKFGEELKERYDTRRPPGYKDRSKPDAGAGDLLIWKTILAEGETRKAHCIFVTADNKSDWYVQAGGPFQPRLELLDEYRLCCGKTIHIVPLSSMLKLFEASPETVEDVKRAEQQQSAVERLRALSMSEEAKHAEQDHLLAKESELQKELDLWRSRILQMRGDKDVTGRGGDDHLEYEHARMQEVMQRLLHLRLRRLALDQRETE